MEELSNWYVRRNRRCSSGPAPPPPRPGGFATLYTCLTTVTRLVAPFMPYVARGPLPEPGGRAGRDAPQSVHLATWPVADPGAIDEGLLRTTARLLETVSLGRSARRTAGLRVRQPLSEVVVRAPEGAGALSGSRTSYGTN